MEMKTKTFSRRDFLRMAVAVGASALPLTQKVLGGVLSTGVGTVVAAPAEPEMTPILAMHYPGELTDAYVSQFNADYPSIVLTRIDVDMNLYYSSFAAGIPPDLLRTQVANLPYFLWRHIPLNLQAYFDASTVLYPADLVAVNDYYKATGPFHIGEGDLYGMVKDWSPDTSLWVNEAVFEAAGATPPNPADMPIDKDQLVALCTAVTNNSAGRFGYATAMTWIDRVWMVLARSAGGSLYADDFSRINIVGNSVVEEAIKYFLDLAAAGLMQSPINPTPSGWFGQDFVNGNLAMLSYGFWFSGMFGSQASVSFQQAVADNKVKMYPYITWHGKQNNPCYTGTGAIISSPARFPDAAWKVFEWFHGGQPAIDRAGSGWGLPGLNSLYYLVPKDGPFHAQVWETVMKEMPYDLDSLHFNPFITESSPGWPAQVFNNNWEAALKGKMTFHGLLALVEAETNAAIKEGMPKVYLPLVSRP